MTALSQPLPLAAYRERIDAYLRAMPVPYASMAGTIIAAQLAAPPRSARLSPELVVWACEAVGGHVEHALPTAAAIDLFERSDALRDDLLVDASLYSIGQTLNGGDALNALAYRLLVLGDAPLARRLQASRVVTEWFVEAIRRRNDAIVWAGFEAGALLGGASESVAQQFRRAGRWLAADGEGREESVERGLAALAGIGIPPARLDALAAALSVVAARG